MPSDDSCEDTIINCSVPQNASELEGLRLTYQQVRVTQMGQLEEATETISPLQIASSQLTRLQHY